MNTEMPQWSSTTVVGGPTLPPFLFQSVDSRSSAVAEEPLPLNPVAQLVLDGTAYIQRMAALLPVDPEADARFAALKRELAHRIPRRVLWKP